MVCDHRSASASATIGGSRKRRGGGGLASLRLPTYLLPVPLPRHRNRHAVGQGAHQHRERRRSRQRRQRSLPASPAVPLPASTVGIPTPDRNSDNELSSADLFCGAARGGLRHAHVVVALVFSAPRLHLLGAMCVGVCGRSTSPATTSDLTATPGSCESRAGTAHGVQPSSCAESHDSIKHGDGSNTGTRSSTCAWPGSVRGPSCGLGTGCRGHCAVTIAVGDDLWHGREAFDSSNSDAPAPRGERARLRCPACRAPPGLPA